MNWHPDVITSTVSSWGIKIRQPLRTILARHQPRANAQVAAKRFSNYILHKPRFFWHYLILCRRDCRVRSSCIISARNDITSYDLTVRTLGYRIGKLLLITINYYILLPNIIYQLWSIHRIISHYYHYHHHYHYHYHYYSSMIIIKSYPSQNYPSHHFQW